METNQGTITGDVPSPDIRQPQVTSHTVDVPRPCCSRMLIPK